MRAAVNRICVYCGSNVGADPAYAAAARELGRVLASRDIGVVYGGASVGLMGALADAALAGGGEVIGVIPEALDEREVAHRGVDLRVVGSMHERKETFVDLADGFVALPGGLGTLEELFEILTWAQLGIHRDPCGLLDVAGYYEGIVDFLDHAVEEGFVHPDHRDLLYVAEDPETLLAAFADYEPPAVEKWLDRDET
ncbi:MAG: TIGR00730 family Rossman fold protein [Haloarculaceae archaeon]